MTKILFFLITTILTPTSSMIFQRDSPHSAQVYYYYSIQTLAPIIFLTCTQSLLKNLLTLGSHRAAIVSISIQNQRSLFLFETFQALVSYVILLSYRNLGERCVTGAICKE
uniref:Uncharacterized protein n=1 Tax=Physcomitrium patens TaxID=3218 RepID=A0A2K1JZG6_PHYPA|nr:hypothetical protein PHYPA_014044 [Physcomitrium patens]